MKISEEAKKIIINEFEEFKKRQYDGKTVLERKELNQFFTPPELSFQLIEEFENLKGTFFDPTCGSSNLLMAVAIVKKIDLGEKDEDIDVEIFGYDIDERMINLSKQRFENYFGHSFENNFIVCDYTTIKATKTFDKGIANPPFNKNGSRLIELEVMENMLKQCNNAIILGTTTNVLDLAGDLKRGKKLEKYKNVLNNNLKKLIKVKNSEDFFDIDLAKELGVFIIEKNKGADFDSFRFTDSNGNDLSFLYNKIIKRIDGTELSLKKHWSDDKNNENYLPLKVLVSKGNYNIVSFEKPRSKSNEPEDRKKEWNVARGLILEKNQQENFKKSVCNEFYFFLVKKLLTSQNIKNINRFLPFMGDYTKVWTNDDYFNYFKLSECEKEIILKEMKEYTKKFKEKYID